MGPDMLDVIWSLDTVNNSDCDKGLSWVSVLFLSINPVSPYMVEKHVAYSGKVLGKTGLHYPEQSVLCGGNVVGKRDGFVPDFVSVEKLVDFPVQGSCRYCVQCLKQASFILGVFG